MATSSPGDDGNLPYHMDAEASTDTTLDVTLAKTLAAASDQDPVATDFQLYDHIEPEALERLFSHATDRDTADWEFSFSVDEYTVTLDSDGEITID